MFHTWTRSVLGDVCYNWAPHMPWHFSPCEQCSCTCSLEAKGWSCHPVGARAPCNLHKGRRRHTYNILHLSTDLVVVWGQFSPFKNFHVNDVKKYAQSIPFMNHIDSHTEFSKHVKRKTCRQCGRNNNLNNNLNNLMFRSLLNIPVGYEKSFSDKVLLK